MKDAIRLSDMIDLGKYSRPPKRAEIKDFVGKKIYITEVSTHKNVRFDKAGVDMTFTDESGETVKVGTTSKLITAAINELILMTGKTKFEQPIECVVVAVQSGMMTYYTLR